MIYGIYTIYLLNVCTTAGRAEMFYPPGHVAGQKYPLLVFTYVASYTHRTF